MSRDKSEEVLLHKIVRRPFHDVKRLPLVVIGCDSKGDPARKSVERAGDQKPWALSNLCLELLWHFGNVVTRGRPVCIARVAVEDQGARFEGRLKFVLSKIQRNVVVIRTHRVEHRMIAHRTSAPGDPSIA